MKLKNIVNKRRAFAYLLSIIASLSLSGSDVHNENSSIALEYDSIMESSYKGFSEANLSLQREEVKEEIEEIKNLDNIDYSDLFIYDNRTVEGSIKIANGVREKLSCFSLEEKYEYALNKIKVSKEELDTVLAVLGVESGPTYYVDGFATMTNVLNRGISYKYSYYIAAQLGIDFPISIYHHIVAPSQYGPFWSKSYLDNMGKYDNVTVEAFLDAICSYDLAPRMHDYLNFYEWENQEHHGVYYVEYGNKFERILQDNDIIPLEERYYYEEEKTLSLDKY